MPRKDPYADLAASYAEDVSLNRIRSASARTPKVATEASSQERDEETFIAPEIPLYDGFHVDGDRRYEER